MINNKFISTETSLSGQVVKLELNPSQDSSIGSVSACSREVPGSNPGKGENFSVKISNWIVRI